MIEYVEGKNMQSTSDERRKLEEPPVPDAYSTFIAKNPWRAWVCGLTTMLIFIILGMAIALGVKGNFGLAGADVGFESRGSALAGKIIAYDHILRGECTSDTSAALTLAMNGDRSRVYRWEVSDESDNPAEVTVDQCFQGYKDDNRRKLQNVPPVFQQTYYEEVSRDNQYDILENSKNGLSMLFKGTDLFSAESLRGMCRIDADARNRFSGYANYCRKSHEFEHYDGYDQFCSPSRSLPNYVAALTNQTSCDDISDANVTYVKNLLGQCKSFYENKKLVGNCWDFETNSYTTKRNTETRFPSCDLPVGMEECARFEAVYDILHSLTPSSWDTSGALSYTQSIMPGHPEDLLTAWEQDYETIIGTSDGGATVVVVYYEGIKGELFNEGLLGAAPNFLVLVLITYVVILVHTGSFWITTCGILQIFCAFLWGFVFYVVVFWRNFFPFLNLIALFLIMGVGADDIFVYVDAWRQSFAKLPESCSLDQRLSWTLRRAGTAMMVTTATTAISFLANMTNPITAMKGFGLFTACVIVSDFLLMIIFIPATLTLHHLHFSKMATAIQIRNGMLGCSGSCTAASKVSVQHDQVKVDEEEVPLSTDEDRAVKSNKDCCCRSCCCCSSTMDIDVFAVPSEIDPSTGTHRERWAELTLRKHVSPVLLHGVGRFVFITVTMAVAGYLYTSAIQLEKPSSSYMQLLDEAHPLEVYEKTQEKWFDIGNGNSFDFPYIFVFGLDPIDNGDFMDPSKRGTPVFKHIDVSLPASQQYLYEFCDYVANSTMSPQSSLSLDTNVCGMYWFKSWMETSCASTTDSDSNNWMLEYPERASSSGCCGKNSSDFPYDASVFNTCMNIFSSKMSVDKDANHGFWFDTSGNLKVVVVMGSSTVKYSQTFSESDSFYNNLIDFFKARSRIIGSVPSGSGLQNAFATTEINFYAMQLAITQGAYDSAMYSTIFALIVLVLLTRRLVSSVLVAFHLACVVVCVLGVFVRLGWVLGVVESVIAALAVGLACDFAAHLAHSFNDEEPHALENETPLTFPRTMDELFKQLALAKEKATGAVTNLGVTITMGFLSTFFAGCCLLVTDLYFTQQFGIFMCCVMAFSFCFAFLYLMPVLATVGWTDRLLADWTQRKIVKPVYALIAQEEENTTTVKTIEKDENHVLGGNEDIEIIGASNDDVIVVQGVVDATDI